VSLTRIGLSIVALLAAIVGAYALFQALDARTAPPIIIEDVAANRPVVVDVRGAVSTPGVFALPPDARVQDAVAAAGGLSVGADLATVNLARRLRDGEAIVIPEQPAIGGSPVPPSFPGQADESDNLRTRINLNTASLDELDVLPGVGEVTARRIVEFREQNGPYRSIDDLIHVEGISARTIEEFRDQVTTGP